MKKSISVILVSLSISLFTFGGHAADEVHSHGHSRHSSVAITNGLSLDNGERWEMDDHTRKMSAKMKETFFSADHSSQASLNALGTQLEAQLGELINGCTMNGEAHDQLHIFLTDYVQTVQNLAKAGDYDTARNSAIKIKVELEAYKKYFK